MFLKVLKQCSCRAFSNSSFLKIPDKVKPIEPNPGKAGNESGLGATVVPRNWEKKLLIWAGKYKSVDEIPSRISYDTMNKAKSIMRIRISNIMMVTTLISCFVVVYMGKKRAKEGDSIVKRVQERDERVKAKARM